MDQKIIVNEPKSVNISQPTAEFERTTIGQGPPMIKPSAPLIDIDTSAIIDSWMAAPTFSVNSECPRGLEYLTQISRLMVKQKVRPCSILTGFQTNNKFKIKNIHGENVFIASERTDCCLRQFCPTQARPFDIEVLDAAERKVLHFTRPFTCFMSSLEVEASGEVIGRVEQNFKWFYPKFSIKNHLGETVLRIEGPCSARLVCCCEADFNIVTLDGTKIGKISKNWSGLAREFFTDADNFGIEFPMDLDVRMKAVLLGACLLIDFMFYGTRH